MLNEFHSHFARYRVISILLCWRDWGLPSGISSNSFSRERCTRFSGAVFGKSFPRTPRYSSEARNGFSTCLPCSVYRSQSYAMTDILTSETAAFPNSNTCQLSYTTGMPRKASHRRIWSCGDGKNCRRVIWYLVHMATYAFLHLGDFGQSSCASRYSRTYGTWLKIRDLKQFKKKERKKPNKRHLARSDLFTSVWPTIKIKV